MLGVVRISPGLANLLLTVSRDVAAGVAILLEAGGLMTTANPPPDEATCPIPDVKLGSRLYLAIR
jgi:fructose-1,6-bisphosphatase/inositol monophosphatase family enzyme